MPRIPPDILHPTLWNQRQRRAGRQARSALGNLVTSPHNLTTALVMPASVMLAVSHDTGLTLGATTIQLTNGAQFAAPTLAADVIYKGLWVERGQSVSITGAPTGVLSLHYVDSLNGRLVPVIGTLTVA